MKDTTMRRVSGFVVAVLLAGLCPAQEIAVTPRNANGVYDLKEKIEWRLQVRGPDAARITEAHYILKKGASRP